MKGIFKTATVMLACLTFLGIVAQCAFSKTEEEKLAEDIAVAQAILDKAEAGDADAQFVVGKVLCNAKDYKNAKQLFEMSAAQGHAGSQFQLGFMYSYGLGVRQDYAVARQWFEKSAAQGLASAQLNLGVLFEEGLGVRQSQRTAKEWYGKACDNGNQRGCDGYRRLNDAGF